VFLRIEVDTQAILNQLGQLAVTGLDGFSDIKVRMKQDREDPNRESDEVKEIVFAETVNVPERGEIEIRRVLGPRIVARGLRESAKTGTPILNAEMAWTHRDKLVKMSFEAPSKRRGPITAS
jgi:hypothetical protein